VTAPSARKVSVAVERISPNDNGPIESAWVRLVAVTATSLAVAFADALLVTSEAFPASVCTPPVAELVAERALL
jgi:hypothetical protein